MQANESCIAVGPSARLSYLQARQQFWKSPKGFWRREFISESESDAPGILYYQNYQNMWVRCRKEGGSLRWNNIHCVSWEPLTGGEIVKDTWALLFQFCFEGLSANPSRNLLYLVDTRTVPGERTFRYVSFS